MKNRGFLVAAFGISLLLFGCSTISPETIQSVNDDSKEVLKKDFVKKVTELKVVYYKEQAELKPGAITIWIKNGDRKDFYLLHEVIEAFLQRKFEEKFVPKEIYESGDWLGAEYLYEKDIVYSDGTKTTFTLHAGSTNWHGGHETYRGVWAKLVCPEACSASLVDDLLSLKVIDVSISRDGKEQYKILKSRLPK